MFVIWGQLEEGGICLSFLPQSAPFRKEGKPRGYLSLMILPGPMTLTTDLCQSEMLGFPRCAVLPQLLEDRPQEASG